jgi:cobalt-zinc-cadmium efflux system membrane fusion protein
MKGTIHSWRRFAALALFAVWLLTCARPTPTPPQPQLRIDGTTVALPHGGSIRLQLVEAQAGSALPLSPVTGRVIPIEALTSPAFAPLPGRVVESKVRLGDHVQRGQKLVQIRSAELPTLEHGVRTARLAVATDSDKVTRLRALVQSQAGSINDLLLAESELTEAKLAVRAAHSRRSSLQVKCDDDTTYWVIAARNGTVVQLDATPGLQVGPDRGPLVTVAELSQVLVVGDLAQRDAMDLRADAGVEVYAGGTAAPALPGVVEAVSEIVDPERQTVPVRVRVDNAQRRLRPNAFVDLGFGAANARSAVLVPAAALVRDGASAVVFVETAPGTLQKRQVQAGRRSRGQVEINGGLAAGEKVVTSGALLLLNAIKIGA